MIKPIMTDVLFLGQKSQEASREDLYIAKDLRDTLAYHKDACVGMAANMIGEKKCVIIANIGFINLVMFNPVLTAKSDPFETEESCLSLVGSRPTKRYGQIEVAYRDEDWMPKKIKLEGFAAQIVQHELDHLEGIII